MANSVQVDFEAKADDFIADAKKVQKEMDAFSAKLKESGVSQAAYNKAVANAKKSTDDNTAATQKSRLSMTDLHSAVSLVREAVQFLGQAYAATIGETLEYANQVRSLSQISGESAENTSRFIQVLDDYKIGAEDAMTATRSLTKNGLAPNIDTLAKLSDQYLKLNSAEEKNAFVIKNLGRAGLQWVEVLNKGSTAILKQGDAVADGLILNQKQLDQARELELAQDALGESWEQVAYKIGNVAIPALTEMTDGINFTARAIEIMKESGMSSFQVFDNMAAMSDAYTDALKQAEAETLAQREAMLQNTEAVEENTESLEAQEEALKAVSERNSAFLGVLGQVGGALDAYKQGVEESYAALQAGNITIDEHKAKVEELAAQYEQAKNQIVLSIVEMKFAADGWTNAEVNAYLQVGKKLGAFTEQTVQETKIIVAEADKLVAGYDNMGDIVYHAAERAEDAADSFGIMSESAYELSEAGYDAAGGVGATKSQLQGLPPSGTAWQYSFTINVKGRVPKLPDIIGSNTAQEDHFDYHNHAAGGVFTIPQSYGYEGFHMGMGDTASGGETLAIAPQGKDFIDYDRLAAVMPQIDEKRIVRAMITGLQQAGVFS